MTRDCGSAYKKRLIVAKRITCLRRAITYVNAGKLRVKTETEQQLWNECSRLIANAVTYYNTVLLSCICAQKQANEEQTAVDIIKSISPVACGNMSICSEQLNSAKHHQRLNLMCWQHIMLIRIIGVELYKMILTILE